MDYEHDISVNFPAEYFDALSEVIVTGLQKAKIKPEIRTALVEWWNAEREFVIDEIMEKYK